MGRGSIGLNRRLNAYVAENHPSEHPVLAKLREATVKGTPWWAAGMQIAPEQGHFLAFLVHLIGARTALEIGTFTGYSALAVALALPPDGKVVTLDMSEEWTAIAHPHWAEAGVADKIELRLGRATDSLKALNDAGQEGRFDFAFIDADKRSYDAYYEGTLPLMQRGGLIVFDNMLLEGKVAKAWAALRRSTIAIRALNAKLAADPRVEAVLLPVGDGMTLARKL